MQSNSKPPIQPLGAVPSHGSPGSPGTPGFESISSVEAQNPPRNTQSHFSKTNTPPENQPTHLSGGPPSFALVFVVQNHSPKSQLRAPPWEFSVAPYLPREDPRTTPRRFSEAPDVEPQELQRRPELGDEAWHRAMASRDLPRDSKKTHEEKGGRLSGDPGGISL